VFLRLVVTALIVLAGSFAVMMCGGGVMAGSANMSSAAGWWAVALIQLRRRFERHSAAIGVHDAPLRLGVDVRRAARPTLPENVGLADDILVTGA
jgi:hypothetical protein